MLSREKELLNRMALLNTDGERETYLRVCLDQAYKAGMKVGATKSAWSYNGLKYIGTRQHRAEDSTRLDEFILKIDNGKMF